MALAGSPLLSRRRSAAPSARLDSHHRRPIRRLSARSPVPETAIRRTKIVATLGPAWSDPDQMHGPLDAGVNVVRVNASHGTPGDSRRWVDRGPAAGAGGAEGLRSALLLDLQGPRIRVGQLGAAAAARRRAEGDLRPGGGGGAGRDPHDLRGAGPGRPARAPGSCSTTACSPSRSRRRGRPGARRRSSTAASSSRNKGMNLPGVDVSAPALTEKDREDVVAGGGARGGLHRAVVRAAGRGPRELCAGWCPQRHQAGRQDREGHGPPEPRAASSRPPTPSWWPAATSAWSCPSRRCRWCRSGSSARPTCTASRSSPRPRCSSRWCMRPGPPGPRPRTWPTRSSTAPTP